MMNRRLFWKDRHEQIIHVCTSSLEVYLVLVTALRNTDMAYMGFGYNPPNWVTTSAQLGSYIEQAIVKRERMIFHEEKEFLRLNDRDVREKLWDLVTNAT